MDTTTMRSHDRPLPPPPVRDEVPAAVGFDEGLIGLPDARRFAFETGEEIAPLLRMRCLDRPDLSFLVVDPGLVVAGYDPEFSPEALHTVGLGADEPRLLLAVVCISPRPEECTANLLAPLLINPATLRGAQIVLDPAAWSSRHPLVGARE